MGSKNVCVLPFATIPTCLRTDASGNPCACLPRLWYGIEMLHSVSNLEAFHGLFQYFVREPDTEANSGDLVLMWNTGVEASLLVAKRLLHDTQKGD